MSKRKYRSRRRWEDEYTDLWDTYEDNDVQVDDDERGWDDEDEEELIKSFSGGGGVN
jgi:hypothetical protein